MGEASVCKNEAEDRRTEEQPGWLALYVSGVDIVQRQCPQSPKKGQPPDSPIETIVGQPRHSV